MATSTTHRYDRLVAFYDTLASVAVVGPAVIGYWRGTWLLMDLYAFPEGRERSCWLSFVIGLAGHLVFTVLQYRLASVLHPDRRRFTYYLCSRVYTVVFGFCCVNAWRGAWNILDVYTGKHVSTVVGITMTSVCALILTRTLRNLSAPPLAVCTDSAEGYFEVPTMFRVSPSGDMPAYVMDVLFTVVIVGNLVVFVWRGVWLLVDLLLFPSYPVYSAWASLGLGYVIVVISFSLQHLVKKLCDRLDLYPRLLVADIYLLFSFLGTINVWRGIWNLLSIYFIPGTPAMSYWLSHSLCLVLLLLLNCANSVLVRGIYVDAAKEQGGECVTFPTAYLRLFVQTERELKFQRKGQLPTTKRKTEENKASLMLDQQANNTGNHANAQLLSRPDARENPSSDA